MGITEEKRRELVRSVVIKVRVRDRVAQEIGVKLPGDPTLGPMLEERLDIFSEFMDRRQYTYEDFEVLFWCREFLTLLLNARTESEVILCLRMFPPGTLFRIAQAGAAVKRRSPGGDGIEFYLAKITMLRLDSLISTQAASRLRGALGIPE